MKKFLESHRDSLWLAASFLLVVSALVYLPFVYQLGYFKDDWYLMYSAHSQGPQYFRQIYEGIRPARAYVMEIAYSLFGDRPLPYHLTGYLWRWLGALSFLATLRIIWPRAQKADLVMSLLFLIYPGFLSQINPIDYQSQLLSLFLAMLSMFLTVKAITVSERGLKIAFLVLSALLAIAYLSLVEYFIGLEVLRMLWILVLVWREKAGWRDRWVGAARLWIPSLTGPLAFLIWRLFFFQNERASHDVGLQLGQLFVSPIHTGLSWLVYLIQDIFRGLFLAWAVPVYELGFDLRLRDALTGLGWTVMIVLLVLIGISWAGQARQKKRETGEWKGEALWMGLLAAAAASLPVIIANRHADFADYSRYILASSAGAAMVAAVFLFSLASDRLRMAGIALLTMSAAFAHYANAATAALDTQVVHDFWWQVSWRAPQIAQGTTLVASYPVGAIQEDYFVWGPANLIYYPGKIPVTPIEVPLRAAVLTDQNVLQVLTGKGQSSQIRLGISTPADYGDVLVLAQATLDGCVRALDGRQPELSNFDDQRILLIAPRSQSEDVVTDAPPRSPPEAVFGREPEHGWCYYYEKASLARQRGDWNEIVKLGDEALSKGYYPGDSIEWLPFLQAYVALGRQDLLHQRASIMNADPFLKGQTCRILGAAARDDAMRSFIQKTFCE